MPRFDPGIAWQDASATPSPLFLQPEVLECRAPRSSLSAACSVVAYLLDAAGVAAGCRLGSKRASSKPQTIPTTAAAAAATTLLLLLQLLLLLRLLQLLHHYQLL